MTSEQENQLIGIVSSSVSFLIRSDHLKIHMKTHDNQKPFQCTICNRGYNTAAALTSHMQNHKKQAALLASGGALQPLNYSPRSTGSGSSNGSFKRRYNTIQPSPENGSGFIKIPTQESIPNHHPQLTCEYCTMKFPSIPKMFHHIRATHMDRLTSPNSYFENFNFNRFQNTPEIKVENLSPKSTDKAHDKDEEPTDLSQPKRTRSQSPTHTEDRPSSPSKSTDKPNVFMCNQCNAGLPDFDSFRNHLKSHITQGMNLVCQHCGLTLREQGEYERHIISHFLIINTEFSCNSSKCTKFYGKTDDLQKHLYDNHIQSVYKCSICAKIFDTKSEIQVHLTHNHSGETKNFRCTACMDTYPNESEFTLHVKTRHHPQPPTLPAHPLTTGGNGGSNSLQCMFCRAVCSSELEMHFHLAAHARQFRCPSCPETFHVEFLLDRHMQTHHSAQKPLVPPQNNNNNILDYHAFQAGKNLFLAGMANKFYSPLDGQQQQQQQQKLIYGLGQRYFDLLSFHQQEKAAVAAAASVAPTYFTANATANSNGIPSKDVRNGGGSDKTITKPVSSNSNGFSCGICERNDFRTEAEVHSHRKIVHNLKTGVSLRCAYCSGNFKSRSELEHHMKTCHNSTGRHKCLICDEIFPSPAILAEHKLQHSKVGQSGKCSHCSFVLDNVAAFKSHLIEHSNGEGQIPMQCICCRQTLNSDFEVGLHAK